MPSIINSNQVYRVGEVPVFVALVTKMNGTPLTYADVESISITHMQERDGIKNGMIVASWFPVETPNGSVDEVDIAPTNVLDNPINVSATDVAAHTQNFNSALTSYNFLYIPFDGRYYYPNVGNYRTTFKITLKNGQTDILPFMSMVDTVYGNNEPILEVLYDQPPNDVFIFGENIEFTGVLYAKYREPFQFPDETTNPDHGKLIFPNTTDKSDVISNVFLTVFDIKTAQRLIDRESLGNNIITVNNDTYELNYTFPTTRLPMDGMYRFRFEVEARSGITGTDINTILCVFDIDIPVV